MGKRGNPQKQFEYTLLRTMALNLAKQYCEDNQLSYEKLSKQRFDILYDIASFSQPSDVKPNGLLNDMATMPFPTLVIKTKDDEIVFEQTEYTQKYLAK